MKDDELIELICDTFEQKHGDKWSPFRKEQIRKIIRMIRGEKE